MYFGVSLQGVSRFLVSFSSNKSWCLRDTGPRESIVEE